jgi:hypothetical protein
MKLFCMDLHISVIADLKSLDLSVDIEDWTFSGHAFLMGRKRDNINHINANTWEHLSPEMIAAFHAEYDGFLSSFDGFVVAHASCFAQVFEKYGKPVILINSCRIDLPYCFSRDLERRAQHLACLQRLDKAGLLFPVSNNKADQLYTFRATGIKTQHIPSLCLYTKMSYAPSRPTFLCYTGSCPPDRRIVQKKELGTFAWRTIGEFKGVIHFPYEISTMSLFEQFTAGCPMFFPSKEYLRSMPLSSISIYWGDALPSEYGDLSNIDTWIDLADFYDTFVSPNTYYFDSFDHLLSLLDSFVYVNDKAQRASYCEVVKAKWRSIIKDVRCKVMSIKTPAHLSYNRLPVLADIVYDVDYSELGVVPQHIYQYRSIKAYDIVFVKTDLLDWFLANRTVNVPITLITGVSDMSPTESATKLVLENKNITRWIGCNIKARHPKICKIPIGVGERERPNGNHYELRVLHETRTEWSAKSDELCIPYHNSTHSDRVLTSTLEFLPFAKYMRAIGNHKFVLCQRGNGLDTHRICEVLLMGSVPVILHSELDDMYEQFPCVLVDSFDSIDTTGFVWDQSKYEHFLDIFWLRINGIRSILGPGVM